MTRIYIGMRGGLLVADEESPEAVTTHFAGSAIEGIAVDPTDPSRVYVALYSAQDLRGEIDPETAGGLSGVWRSDDGGETWHDVSAGLSHPATLSVSVGQDGTVYAGSEPSTLAISRDHGRHGKAPAISTACLQRAPGRFRHARTRIMSVTSRSIRWRPIISTCVSRRAR